MNDADRTPATGGTPDHTAAVLYLSGPLRGSTQLLADTTLRMALHPAGHLALTGADKADGATLRGSLHRSGASYELVMEDGCQAWVNGQPTRSRLLRAGDLVEVDDGPVFRFRIYAAAADAPQSADGVFADTALPAAAPSPHNLGWPADPGGRMRAMLRRPRFWFRTGVIGAIVALGVLMQIYSQRTQQLAAELEREQAWVQVLAESLREGERDKLTREDLALVRSAIEQGMVLTDQRIAALEARSAAVQTIIANFSRSIVFILGSYGFTHEKSGQPLRAVLGPDGEPIRLPDGRTMMSLHGEGPPMEMSFSGTAFVATTDGLLLTNRHVVLPWETIETGKAAKRLGLKPALHRMQGFIPGEAEPFDVELIGASDNVDLAVLRGKGATRLPAVLRRAGAPARIGDEVIVMGYPTGVRALLARSGSRFVDTLTQRGELNLLGVTRELAKAGLVTPLASRGIVGQVTGEALVYDAETAQGGSGGPVLNLEGEVVAVNTAILPGFGGSNIGVPIAHADALIEQVGVRQVGVVGTAANGSAAPSGIAAVPKPKQAPPDTRR